VGDVLDVLRGEHPAVELEHVDPIGVRAPRTRFQAVPDHADLDGPGALGRPDRPVSASAQHFAEGALAVAVAVAGRGVDEGDAPFERPAVRRDRGALAVPGERIPSRGAIHAAEG
jgi:hypothetical protein